jgi:hypothetical protein
MAAPNFRAKLLAMDGRCAESLRSGDIRLLSMFELLNQRLHKIERRQALEKRRGPSLFLGRRKAAELLKREERRVLVLSFGWGSPSSPDPTGVILEHLIRFLEWLRDELRLSAKEQRNYGVFWDFPAVI